MSEAGRIILNQGDTPTTPGAGKIAMYSKSDDKIYYITSSGVEHWITSSGVIPPNFSILDLTDTPSAYDEGKFLMSTSSGTSWEVGGGGGGTTYHNLLNNLDYTSSNHTGFASSADLTTLSGTVDGKANTIHTHTAEQVYLHTEQTLDSFINSGSAGYISGFTISSGTNPNTVAVASGTVYLKATNEALGDIHYFSVAAQDNIPVTSGTTTYCYVDYNSGTPIVSGTITKSEINGRTKIALGKVFNESSNLHILSAGLSIEEVSRRVQARLNGVDGEVVRASGLIISETGTRNLALTAGTLYAGLTKTTTTSKDTSGTDEFEFYYRDGAGGWVETDQTQINNTQYDDGSGTLATLSNNKYGVHWVFADFDDGHLLVLCGQGDYTLAEAQAAAIPSSLPSHISEFSAIVGKVIILKGASTFYSIESAFTTQFNSAGVTDHGDLSGLSDPDHPQYILHTEFSELDGGSY